MTLKKLPALLRKHRLEREMSEEMQLHLDLQTREHIRRGMTPEDARYAALRSFGGVEQMKERAREVRGWPVLEDFVRDVRHAFRALWRQPGFALAAILTLALGIGFVTTLFTMVNGFAYSQLPFDQPERIVNIDFPPAQYDAVVPLQQCAESVAVAQPLDANLRAGVFASRYRAAIVTVNFLEVLRARPLLGRGFLDRDADPAGERTVLISHEVWSRELEGDPAVIGREVKVNGEVRRVIGIMPAGFGFPIDQMLWLPRLRGTELPGGFFFGRLKEGVALEQATAEFTVLRDQLVPGTAAEGDPRPPVQVTAFVEVGTKPAIRMMLSLILGATLLVLLLACANVSNLILARAADRRKELAVRAAVGATRMRLIRQLLAESFILAVGGALAGLMLATWTTRGLWAYMIRETSLTGGAPFWINFDVDGTVYFFVTIAAIFACLLTGLMPALHASRVDVNATLKDSGGAGTRSSRLMRVLVNAQMALSVCLLTLAGVFAMVVLIFNHKTLPYPAAEVATARIALDGPAYADVADRRAFFDQLVTGLRNEASVLGVSLTGSESLRFQNRSPVEIEGKTYAREADRPTVVREVVSTDSLAGYGLAAVDGRDFDARDSGDAPPVALVNTAFVERYGNGADLLGRRLRLGFEGDSWITIVGVVPDVGTVRAGQRSFGPAVYRPIAQSRPREVTVLLRSKADEAAAYRLIRSHVAALDPELPVGRLRTVQAIVELERIGMNAFAGLFIVCGVGALLLASVGVYGLTSFTVRRRTREFGLRAALGADRGALIRLVTGQGLREIASGLGIGALLALGAFFVVRSSFAELATAAFNAWICVGVIVLLVGIAGIALLLPARRAARVDPMTALRSE